MRPPARLGELTETRYRVHVTDRAAALGIPERWLAAYLEWLCVLADVGREDVG